GPEPSAGPGAASATEPGARPEAPAPGAPLSPAERSAVDQLHRAAAAVLAAGVSGSGAVLQAELLRAAHRARLAGLYRPAAAAVALVTRVRGARSGEPDHRLTDLVAGLRDLLELTTALAAPEPSAPVAELRGTARQTYGPAGGLRLYGLFTEPVLTATHAGVVTWAVDADGRLSTIGEVVPHTDATTAAPQAVGAGRRTVRLGDASLSHREFGRAGLAVQGATRSPAGRLGAGAAVRAVRAAGARWTQAPVAALWAEPVGAQVERALAAIALPYEGRPAGSDLLFLDVTLLGATADTGAGHGGPGAPRLLADCDGLTVALLPAHEHPGLAYRANLALLAAAPGLRLRVIGRLERAARPELRVLAVGRPPGEPEPGVPTLEVAADRADRVNLGLERLQHADLNRVAEPSVTAPPFADRAPEAPVHLLSRRVEQAVTGGRQALALGGGGTAAADAGRLRSVGLGTGAALLDGLRATAGDRPRDVFGRVVADDHGAYTAAWLAAACYGEALAAALCAAGWSTADCGPEGADADAGGTDVGGPDGPGTGPDGRR
ncbi:hypothetical protein ACWEQL_06575, partial [Kitasatospora sp. NPDC004240]